ncbi:hypothetical protein FLP41_10005 [Paracoccus marcusii]|nr:hypothetical protein FLP41_10005 [Paracoccus marcusii]
MAPSPKAAPPGGPYRADLGRGGLDALCLGARRGGRGDRGQDPLAPQIAALWRDDPAATVDGFLALSQVFPAVLRDDAGFRAELTDALTRLVRDGARVAASG